MTAPTPYNTPDRIQNNTPDRFQTTFDQTWPKPLSLDELETILSGNDHFAVIRDPELFWRLFCKELAKAPDEKGFIGNIYINSKAIKKLKKKIDFTISIGNNLIISGKAEEIEAFKSTVEIVRRICCKSVEANRPLCRLIFDTDHHKEHVDIIDEHCVAGRELPVQEICDQEMFAYYIRRNLENLFPSLGATIEESEVEVFDIIQTTKNGATTRSGVIVKEIDRTRLRMKGGTTSIRNCFTVTWGDTIPVGASIATMVEVPLDKFLYAQYLKQIDTDIELQSSDGEEHRLHKFMLRYRGGSLIKLFENETCNRLNNSTSVALAFIDYLYLGATEFNTKYKEAHSFNVEELFNLANQYGIAELAQCCKEICRLSKDSQEREKFRHWLKC